MKYKQRIKLCTVFGFVSYVYCNRWTLKHRIMIHTSQWFITILQFWDIKASFLKLKYFLMRQKQCQFPQQNTAEVQRIKSHKIKKWILNNWNK